MKYVALLIINLFLLTPLCQGQLSNTNKASVLQSSMIWSPSNPGGKQVYIAFRKSFNLSTVSNNASLKLFADSRYILWINGLYVLRGPCRFNPKRPEYDIINLHPFLKKGKNVIAVLVHHYANAINGRIMQHIPGLTAVLEMSGKEILRSDSSWRYNDKTRYLPSPKSWTTIPDVIDARIDKEEWLSAKFDDSEWPFAKLIDGRQWGKMYPREIPLLKETELKGLKLLPSRQTLNAALPIELSAGKEVLIDLGRMAMAYTMMELDADQGSELSMKYALRYENGKPTEMYGVGNTYLARAGIQRFMTSDQWGCHYMLLKCISGKIKILGLSMIDRRYPFQRLGNFKCNDETLNNLWNMAVNTIEVTTDDGYGSDARERNEWLQDPAEPNFITTRVALVGPGNTGMRVFSDPRLLKNIIRHAALSQLPNGQILATFPTDRGPEDCHYVIDDYSCQWIEALKIYYDATGDKAFVKEMWPTLVAQINWFLAHRSPRGLLLAREYTSFDNPLAYITCEGATINAFFHQSLNDANYLGVVLGESEKASLFTQLAKELKVAFNKQLWNNTEEAYNSAYIGDTLYAPTVHAQLIALDRDLVPENRKDAVRKWFLENYKNQGMKHCCNNPDFKMMIKQKCGINMPVVYYWVFQELYRMNTDQMDQEVIQEIKRRWTPMVKYLCNIGTLGESFMNDKGEGSSEACHNYGALPAYFLSSFILGVRLDGPVWKKRVLIEPRLGDLTFAQGKVVTEFGVIPISWKKSKNGKSLAFHFSIPKGIRAEIHFPILSHKPTLIINNMILLKRNIRKKGVTSNQRWISVKNVSGSVFGNVN
ncbi:MAG: hypothetical protein HXX14_11390 [Bacteroidetes bacterium]|nr:hypothetical protein [Bacteroidota bacterium]